jgi:hypothetical protein
MFAFCSSLLLALPELVRPNIPNCARLGVGDIHAGFSSLPESFHANALTMAKNIRA